MKNTAFVRIAPLLTGLALMAFSQSSFAVSTWTFGDDLPQPTTACSADEVKAGTCVATTADANAPKLKGFAVSSTASGPAFAAADLKSYDGGLGVQALGAIVDTGSPQHAVDNSGYTDAVILNFGNTNFDLDSVKIGWKGNSAGVDGGAGADADISVFRYTGIEAAPTPAGTNLTPSLLAGDGWQLVGNYADLTKGTNKDVNSTSLMSSWWMISAYNTSYGVSTIDQGVVNNGGTIGLQNGNDYFKILSVAGTAYAKPTPPQGVPEPGSLALMGAALMGFVVSRRRKQQAV